MAATTPQSKRTTRASTRSQTTKSRDDAQTNASSVNSKGVGNNGVKKPRAKAQRKTRKPASPRSRSSPKPTSDYLDETSNKGVDTATPTSASSNATALTINDNRVKNPIICHQYAPSSKLTSPTSTIQTPFIFTHGAGGTLSAPGVVNFCTGFSSTSKIPLLAFQGSMNLGARVKGFQACHTHVSKTGVERRVVFGGRSMGARAAVVAATEIASGDTGITARLVLVSYPLQGPKDIRDQILLDMPEGFEVLFIVGDRDGMCPLDLLEKVRRKMKAVSRLVVVRGADHGTNVKPASKTKEIGEETGKVAARWLAGEVETKGEALYMNEEE